MTSLRQRMIEDMQVRNLAVGTQQVYVQQVSLFARHFHKSPQLLGPSAYGLIPSSSCWPAASNLPNRPRTGG